MKVKTENHLPTVIPFNVEYLESSIKKLAMTKEDFGRSIGRGSSYISGIMKQGYCKKELLKVICTMYNLDFDTLTTVPQTEDIAKAEDTTKVEKSDNTDNIAINLFKNCNDRIDGLVNNIVGLQFDSKVFYEQIDKLKAEIENLKNKSSNINLSDNEKAVLLLKQMTMYGSCEFKDYQSKALSYGINQQQQEFAIKYLNCIVVNTNNVKWIKRK